VLSNVGKRTDQESERHYIWLLEPDFKPRLELQTPRPMFADAWPNAPESRRYEQLIAKVPP
jgi:hypothetical protein